MCISGALILLTHYQAFAALLGVSDPCEGSDDNARCGVGGDGTVLVCAVGMTFVEDGDSTEKDADPLCIPKSAWADGTYAADGKTYTITTDEDHAIPS